MHFTIKKYPRTPHLTGSRLQPGDEDLSQIPFEQIKNKHLVIEEKIDGANTAISFDTDGTLLLQSRGHYLTGGYRERHYNLMKQWANVHKDTFFKVLGTRYIMYGEWMYAKHSIYYDALLSYFMEFDIFDRKEGFFLDTPSRQKLTSQMPISSVPVLAEGIFQTTQQILTYLQQSRYIREGHIERMQDYCRKNGLNVEIATKETDPSTLMEGLYLKIEENGCVQDRLKYVRVSFAQAVNETETHWIDRPIIPNGLLGTIDDLFIN